MMYVKTKVLPSNINGLGLFADQFIPKGTVVWEFTPGFDRKFSEDQIKTFPIITQQYLKVYPYLSKKSNLYIFPVDNGRYFNHSENPNCISKYFADEDEAVVISLRDIQIGEEMTEDYRTFEKNANVRFE